MNKYILAAGLLVFLIPFIGFTTSFRLTLTSVLGLIIVVLVYLNKGVDDETNNVEELAPEEEPTYEQLTEEVQEVLLDNQEELEEERETE